MSAPARSEAQGDRIEALLREVLAELRRRRKAPRVRAATIARRVDLEDATVPINELDVARARRNMRRRRR